MGLEQVIVVVSGDPGSGKSTVARRLKAALGPEYEFFSGGDFRGEIARRHNMTIDELNEIGKREIWPHKECDDLVVEYGKPKSKMVIDSWLAWHFIPHATKIYLRVDPDVGAQRVFANQRPDEPHKKTVEEVKEMLQTRYRVTNESYIKWYGADMTRMSNYDLVIDTTRKDKDAAFQDVLDFVKKKRNL